MIVASDARWKTASRRYPGIAPATTAALVSQSDNTQEGAAFEKKGVDRDLGGKRGMCGGKSGSERNVVGMIDNNFGVEACR